MKTPRRGKDASVRPEWWNIICGNITRNGGNTVPTASSMGWDQQEINTLYATLSTYVDEQCKAAGHKKPVFIIGEDHDSAKGFLIDLMMFDIVGKKLAGGNPPKFYCETTPNMLGSFNKLCRGIENDELPAGPFARVLSTLLVSRFHGFHPTGVDDESSMQQITQVKNSSPGASINDILNQTLEKRDHCIASKINGPGLLICGTAHCRGVISGLQQKDELHIACFNTHHRPIRETGQILDATNFAKDPANFLQHSIQIGSDSRSMSQLMIPQGLPFIDGMIGMVETAAKAMPHKSVPTK